MICDDFWDRFLLVAKVCYLRDEEADLFDVFDTIRTKLLGGWEFNPKYIAKLDAIIAEEEANAGRRNLS